MSLLRKLFDEVTHSSDKWEPYFEVYERHLTRYRGKEISLVEVGVQKGGSLEMWGEFFGHSSKITGIDVDIECRNLKYTNPNINVFIGDQGDPSFWDGGLASRPHIDIFIDDGGHFMDQQILTFEKVFPILPVGAIYICEDCHTSYMEYNGGGLHRKGSFIEYSKGYIDSLHKDWHNTLDTEQDRKNKIAKDLSGVFFYDSIVVFEKFGKRKMERVAPKQFS